LISGLDITPAVPGGRKIVQAYGDGRFRISGESVQGSVVVWPEGVAAWPVAATDGITIESLDAVRMIVQPIDLLLIGCGKAFVPEPAGLRAALRKSGLGLEWMDTGAACRTYNVLLGEDRRVAAALIAV